MSDTSFTVKDYLQSWPSHLQAQNGSILVAARSAFITVLLAGLQCCLQYVDDGLESDTFKVDVDASKF